MYKTSSRRSDERLPTEQPTSDEGKEQQQNEKKEKIKLSIRWPASILYGGNINFSTKCQIKRNHF